MIRIQELSYTYPQNGRGIGPYSIAVTEGEMLHVTGSSGCGKSTLARCITGLIPHIYLGEMRGSVHIAGHETSRTPLWRLSRLAGFVFQNPSMQMLGNTVEEEIIIGLENLGLSRGAIQERLEESLHRFGLAEFRGRKPQSLSGGEQQKLTLAAILARCPDLLVLDEPLSMLDVTAATELSEHLSELARKGTTIIMFEHRSDYLAGMPGLRVVSLDSVAPSGALPFPIRKKTIAPPATTKGLDVSDFGISLGNRVLLENLNFSVEPGIITAVVGRNGCGKTSLLRALAGLQKHRGTALIDGKTPDFGQVYQNADLQLFNPSVRSEILYRVKNPDMDLYAWLMETLRLRPYENTPPLILSEGEKKRVALAAVLMRNPAHGILLDEPSLGLDTHHKTMLMQICRGLAERGKIVILTTHELHLAAMADRMILIGRNGIAADGPPDHVFLDMPAWERAGMFVPSWMTCHAEEEITA